MNNADPKDNAAKRKMQPSVWTIQFNPLDFEQSV